MFPLSRESKRRPFLFMARRTLIQRSRAVSSKAKATFHELEGAGRRKVKREFFGLNAQDEQALADRISKGLDDAIRDTR